MINCVRCHARPVQIHGQMCDICKMNVEYQDVPPESALDMEVMEYYTNKAIVEGCKGNEGKCKNNNFAFEAGVKVENGLKWFVMFVQCEECNEKYTDILDVRTENESEECE
jgi:hypothetical protein